MEDLLVVNIIERTQIHMMILIPVEKKHTEVLKDIFCKYAKPDSIIYGDYWRGYSKIYIYFSLFIENYSIVWEIGKIICIAIQ